LRAICRAHWKGKLADPEAIALEQLSVEARNGGLPVGGSAADGHPDGFANPPLAIQADTIIEIGRFLDEHGKSMPISMFGARAVLQERLPQQIAEKELQQLLVEMCASRGLALLFDDRDLQGD